MYPSTHSEFEEVRRVGRDLKFEWGEEEGVFLTRDVVGVPISKDGRFVRPQEQVGLPFDREDEEGD